MDIDRPLEEIIDEKRAERRKNTRGRGRGRGAARGGAVAGGRGAAAGTTASAGAGAVGPVRNKYSGNIAAAKNAGPAKSAVPAVPLMADGSKIIVSNLPQDVTENQIRDLFTQTVGPVTRISLSYDKHGKSTGIATIELRRPGDAQVAFTQYNGRLVDGTKPMKVEILFDPTRLPPPPLNSRIAPAPAAKAAATTAGTAVAASGAGKAPSSRGRGRGRGGRRGGRGGKSERPSITADDLDAEMEDYQKKLTTA